MAANSWHTDVTFVDRVPAISVLRGVDPAGVRRDHQLGQHRHGVRRAPGTTEGTGRQPVGRAHQRLRLRPLHRVGRGGHRLQLPTRGVRVDDFQTEHPVVRIHPETGERSLVLGHFVKKLRRPEQLRVGGPVQAPPGPGDQAREHRALDLGAGDVAMWDNRATQHYAVADFDTQPREMRRITVAGDVPVSIDGRRSIVRSRQRRPLLLDRPPDHLERTGPIGSTTPHPRDEGGASSVLPAVPGQRMGLNGSVPLTKSQAGDAGVGLRGTRAPSTCHPCCSRPGAGPGRASTACRRPCRPRT